MGDIKRLRKKYTTPSHPWNATRIKLEKNIMHKYGVANKKEIWKMESILKGFKDQAKLLLTRTDDQANKERQQMHDRLVRLGLIKQASGIDDILGLQLKDIMNRRLQTLIVQKRLGRTIKHARQLITHEHIMVNGRKITSPSYLVRAEEETSISYSPDSPFMAEMHPEAFDAKVAQTKLARQRARAERKGQEFDEIIVFDENTIEDPEAVSKENEFDASVADLKDDDVKKAPAKVQKSKVPAAKTPKKPESAEKSESTPKKPKAASKKTEKETPVEEKSEKKTEKVPKPGKKTEETPEKSKPKAEKTPEKKAPESKEGS